jgi:hypothetical protein
MQQQQQQGGMQARLQQQHSWQQQHDPMQQDSGSSFDPQQQLYQQHQVRLFTRTQVLQVQVVSSNWPFTMVHYISNCCACVKRFCESRVEHLKEGARLR